MTRLYLPAVLIIFFVFMTDCLHAQSSECGLDLQTVLNFSSYDNFEDDYVDWVPNNLNFTAQYTIPVVIHVFNKGGAENISNEQIQRAIVRLNADFGGSNSIGYNTNISFALAQVDPEGNCTNGIVRVFSEFSNFDPLPTGTWRDASIWPTDRYLNVWVVESLEGDILGISSHLTQTSAELVYDGVTVIYTEMGDTEVAANGHKTVLTHEVGHYLGLYHAWGLSEDGCDNCHVPNDDLLLGDRVSDTNRCSSSLPTSEQDCGPYTISCDNPVCDQGISDIYPKDNYMTFAFDCHSKFTRGQALRMYFALENYRTDLKAEDVSNTVINSNYTWPNGVHHIDGDLVVTDGATLTISFQTTLLMCTDKKIVIQDGARMVLGGKIKNAISSDHWSGIIVDEGAELRTEHSAEISYAALALTSIGGDIYATSTHFYNNESGGYFDWKSGHVEFNDCMFSVDNNKLSTVSSYFLRFNDNVNRIDIRGGIFQDDFNHAYSGIRSSNGLFTIAATYEDDKYGMPNGTNPTRFVNLSQGIHASNGLTKTYSVENALFTNCEFGVYNDGVSGTKIVHNLFTISDDQTGVMYEGPTESLILQENKFSGLGGNTTGVVCKDISTANNRIRRNAFTDLTRGNISEGVNGNIFPSISGLEYHCTDNDNVDFDFWLAPGPQHKIKKVQGLFDGQGNILSSGNTFHYNSAILESDFASRSEEVNYHYDPNKLNEEPLNYRQVSPISSNENLCLVETFIDFPPILTETPGPVKEQLDDLRDGIASGQYDLTEKAISDQLAYLEQEWDYYYSFLNHEAMISDQKSLLANSLESSSEAFEISHTQRAVQDQDISSMGDFVQRLVNRRGEYSSIGNDIQMYNSILDLLKKDGLDKVSLSIEHHLLEMYNQEKNSEHSKSWIRRFLYPYGHDFPITYSKPSVLRHVIQDKTDGKQNDSITSIYPNPARSEIFVNSPTAGQCSFYDLKGRLLLVKDIHAGVQHVDISGLTSGIVIYEMRSGGQVHRGKVVKL